MSRKIWILLLLHSAVIFCFAWQLDIVCSPLVFQVRDWRFYFLHFSISFWEAYAFFFWGLGLGAFLPEFLVVGKSLWKARQGSLPQQQAHQSISDERR